MEPKMHKKKILIVDDEPDILKLTSLRLRKLGYDVLTAVNGQEGLESIRGEKPDLVLLDLILPIVSGADVCRKTKNDEKLEHIPIILFAASCDTITAEKAKELGAEDYMVKPFNPKELMNKVERILTGGVVL
jgi:two-component system alkaline phosphatase synthesis response regulator PhoP